MHSERKVYSPGMQNNICSLARIQTKTSHGRVYLISHRAKPLLTFLYLYWCVLNLCFYFGNTYGKKNSFLHNFLSNKFVTFFSFFFGRGHWAGDHLSIWMFITDHSLHVIYDLFSCLSVIVSWGMNTGSFLYVKLSAISSPREINFVWICLKLKWNVKLFIVSTKTGTQQQFSIKLTIWTFSSKNC